MIEEFKHIAGELDARLSSAREAIAEAAMVNDWDRAQRITSTAQALETTRLRVETLGREVRKAVAEFDAATRHHTKSKRTKLLITIRWGLAGVSLPDQVIDDDKAADAIGHLIEALVSVQGAAILPEIGKIRAGGSGLVSQDPDHDFRNPNSHEPYGHRPVGATGWAIKTHSSTGQKREQIEQIRIRLGFPPKAIEVEVVEK